MDFNDKGKKVKKLVLVSNAEISVSAGKKETLAGLFSHAGEAKWRETFCFCSQSVPAKEKRARKLASDLSRHGLSFISLESHLKKTSP